MDKFFLVIFLASLFGIWHYWRRNPNKRLLITTIATAIISLLLFGAFSGSTNDVNAKKSQDSNIAKK